MKILSFHVLCLGVAFAFMPAGLFAAAADKSTVAISSGIAIYQEHCAKCHRPFDETTKPQRSVGRLRSSIQHFPAMRSLEFLTDAQLEALAAALMTVPLQVGSVGK